MRTWLTKKPPPTKEELEIYEREAIRCAERRREADEEDFGAILETWEILEEDEEEEND